MPRINYEKILQGEDEKNGEFIRRACKQWAESDDVKNGPNAEAIIEFLNKIADDNKYLLAYLQIAGSIASNSSEFVSYLVNMSVKNRYGFDVKEMLKDLMNQEGPSE